MRFLITGHTGFKGSWLSAMLKIQGHDVSGVSLEQPKKSLFNQAEISNYLTRDYRINIRDLGSLRNAFQEINPEVVIHLAAQPLVRDSYLDPVGTYMTNVIGTLNVLEATKNLHNLRATLVITTDKVYRNLNKESGYVEADELGGMDPYSSSKAAADLATQSWRSSFAKTPLSIARAGNVIGGGDFAKNRIIPDLIDSIFNKQKLILRMPNSVRPWQHVLDCLNGYLFLVNDQISNQTQGEWNFGPNNVEKITVNDLVNTFISHFEEKLQISIENSDLKETNFLMLNSDKSRNLLGWKNNLTFEDSVRWTADWYKNSDKKLITQKQIEKFLSL